MSSDRAPSRTPEPRHLADASSKGDGRPDAGPWHWLDGLDAKPGLAGAFEAGRADFAQGEPDRPAPRTPGRHQLEEASATIKGAIGALLDAGGYHLPEAQLALLLELSFKAGCLEIALAHGDMDIADVEPAWQAEKVRRADRLREAGIA